MNDDSSSPQQAPSLTVTWRSGGHARLTWTDGQHARFSSTAHAAPGTPLLGQDGSGREFQFKVRGCRRLTPDTFEIAGRFVNLSRVGREALLLCTARGDEGTSAD